MHIKSIVAGAALALAATIGSASAAEQFSTLKGLPAVAMAPAELAATRGMNDGTLTTPAPGTVVIPGAGATFRGAHAVLAALAINPNGQVSITIP